MGSRSYLKKRILVQGVGGSGFQTTDICRYFEDLKTGPNTRIGPKDFFEIASNLSNRRGVTLVELLIVTAMLGSLAMLAYPRMVLSMEDSRLRSGAARVVTAIETAQIKAIHSGQRTRVIFDPAADSLRAEQYALPDAIINGGSILNETEVESGAFEPMEDPLDPGGNYTLTLDTPLLLGGVDMTGAVFGGGSTITFSAFGAPQDGGTVTLACGGRQSMISVDPLTGKVTVTH